MPTPRQPKQITLDAFEALSREIAQLAADAQAVADQWREGGPESISLERLPSTIDGLESARTMIAKAGLALRRESLEAALDQ